MFGVPVLDTLLLCKKPIMVSVDFLRYGCKEPALTVEEAHEFLSEVCLENDYSFEYVEERQGYKLFSPLFPNLNWEFGEQLAL